MKLADLPYAFRRLRKNPGFTAVALLTLALGIGPNVAIFSVVDGVLLRPLPLPESDRLVSLCTVSEGISQFCIASRADLRDWDRMSDSFQAMGIHRGDPFSMEFSGKRSSLRGGMATGGLFAALGVDPLIGRTIEPDDRAPGAAKVAVLSYGFWQSRYAGETGALGQTLTADGENYTIVGVMPEGFEVPRERNVRFWIPLPTTPDYEDNRQWRGMLAFGRLADGVSLSRARSEMDSIAKSLEEAYPESNSGVGVEVEPVLDRIVGSARPALLLFLGAVGLVLLIGCVNLATLMLARTARRERELAVRAALGAGRMRVARLMLFEGLLLSSTGGLLGLLLAHWLLKAFLAMAPSGIPRLEQVAIDWRSLLFAAAASLVSCLIFGLLPSLRVWRLDISKALVSEQRGSSSRLGGLFGMRSLLVSAEVAMALMLLVGAGLLVRSFLALQNWDPGFSKERLLTIWTLAPSEEYETREQVVSLFRQVVEEVDSIAEIDAAGIASSALFEGREPMRYLPEGRTPAASGESHLALSHNVDPGLLPALGVPLLRGRGIQPQDGPSSPSVVLVNEALAQRWWPGGEAVGKTLRLTENEGATVEIVGIVADVPHLIPGEEVQPTIYFPFAQYTRWGAFLVMRTDADPASMGEVVRSRLDQAVPSLLVSSRTATFRDRLNSHLKRPRFNASLAGAFAFAAMVLAAVGVYGVISDSVARRIREIGIRVALGARPVRVVRLVVRQGMAPTLVGLAVGAAAAAGLSGSIASLVPGVRTWDPATFVLTGLLLGLVALAACWLPARRASRIDPVEALRRD